MSPIWKRSPGANVLDAVDGGFFAGLLGIVRVHFHDFAVRRLGQVRRGNSTARELRDGGGMVGMLVGDQDAVHALRLRRPSASNRRRISLRPSPASMRRVVRSVSSNVALPVLPEARMDMRNEMRDLVAPCFHQATG